MKIRNVGAMSLRWGLIHCISPKQKLNTKSSTEAKVVELSDYVPFNISIRIFMEAQGYPLKSNVVYQYNESAIHMKRNSQSLCTEKSCHIHIRYFSVKEKARQGII